MSKLRILVYHEWLVDNQWPFIWGISDRIWFNLQESELYSDAIHDFPEVYRRPELFMFQSLPIMCYKMLKRLRVEDRENAFPYQSVARNISLCVTSLEQSL